MQVVQTSEKKEISGNLYQISDIFAKARQAQKTWASFSFAKRRACIEKMSDYIVAHPDELVDILVRETGKTRVDALADEVFSCAFACKWYGEQAGQILKPRNLKTSISLMFHKKSRIYRLPLGVVGIISPWNYPLSIPFGEVIMGLMAGNAILLKGPDETPQTIAAIESIVKAGNVPSGLFTIVKGPGADVADAFFKHRIDKIFFTGSVEVGKELMRKASATLTPLSLELGGKDPMIVMEDADLERASNGAAWGGYQNAGQTCAGVERVYVHEKIYEPFLKLLTAKTKALRHGHFSDPDVDIGAITTPRQFAKIKEHVNEALAKGAQIVAQSQAKNVSEGNFFPATLITSVDHSMTIMREETFGPILCVMKFKTEEEAIRLANDSHYALTSSIWTKDLSRGKRIAQKIEAGVTTINDHILTHALAETPWGGWKDSGLGRTHGQAGLEEMTHCKVVNWDTLQTKRNFYWYPFDQATYDGLKAAMRFSFPKNAADYIKQGKKLAPFAIRKMFSSWKT
ncbi:MAG: aldehyde dehydrogenase family protein [Deltaproteobacteria bacterium]|nr:aldehyde dehydrogenase family protein [Deltaproteobacteria bacterium]